MPSEPKPVESAEDVAQAIANAAYNLGLAPARELLDADRATIRAERDAYWRGKVQEAVVAARKGGFWACNSTQATIDAIMAEVLGDE